jgi:tryptophan synthase alpha chain
VTATTGKSRIADTFAATRRAGMAALIPYVTVGHPQKSSTLEIVPALVEGGATMVELGIPFSDPLADGATIQRSSFQALANGVTVEYCLETVRELRNNGVDVPLIFMGYFNPMLRYGLREFVHACAQAGVDGLIVPDLPPEESDELADLCRQHGRDLIFMVAPTSRDVHIEAVARQASGFLYCVSLTGVTGARTAVSEGLSSFLARVRTATDLPLAVGFGISEPEHVATVSALADGVIVGSALVGRLDDAGPERVADAAREFMRYLRGDEPS